MLLSELFWSDVTLDVSSVDFEEEMEYPLSEASFVYLNELETDAETESEHLL